MGRKKKKLNRPIDGDPIYNDIIIAQFTNKMMLQGKKSVAQRIMKDAFAIVEEKVKKDAKEVFEKALNNAKPEVEVRSRRVGGATYQVPVEVRKGRQTALAMRWIINYSRKRGGKGMADKLAAELIDCYNKATTSSTIKKREDTHRMAEANKAFAHFKW
jgi:small subunit ribosomal protein S7